MTSEDTEGLTVLKRLTPNEISDMWGALSPIIEGTLPPIASRTIDRTTRILEMLLKGMMCAWVLLDDGGLYSVITGGVTGDPYSGSRNFLVYSVFVGKRPSKDMWNDAFQAIRIYARHQGCCRVVFYTVDSRIVELAKHLGAEIKTFVSLEV